MYNIQPCTQKRDKERILYYVTKLRRGMAANRLRDVYDNPSQIKQDAWRAVVEFATQVNGVAYVVSYNCQRFTALVESDDAYYLFSYKQLKLLKEDIK